MGVERSENRRYKSGYSQSGATQLYLDSSYFAQLCAAGLKMDHAVRIAQCWHLMGKSPRDGKMGDGCEYWGSTASIW